MKRCVLPLLGLLLAFAGLACAGPLPAPRIVPGQFIYTIPAHFSPPMIGTHGLQEIQRQARGLHYPFYVVVIKDLPGSTDEDAAAAINGLAEDWSAQAHYDVGHSTIFLLSSNPRKYRMLAGATWKSKLGLERDALLSFLERFTEAVQGTPKDPKTGIINLMHAFDAHIYDSIDPARVAARQQAERLAAQQQRLHNARARKAAQQAAKQQRLHNARLQLDEEIDRTDTLLATPAETLPTNLQTERNTLAAARRVRQGTDVPKIEASTAALRDINSMLDALAAQHTEQVRQEDERRMAAEMRQGAKVAGIVLLFGVVLLLCTLRVRTYLRRRDHFQQMVREWVATIACTKKNYLRFYEERCNTSIPPGLIGDTPQLLADIMTETNEVYAIIMALENHLVDCNSLAKHASVLSIAPLKTAQTKLESAFEFDLAQLQPTELFTPPQEAIKVQPAATVTGLEERFAAAQAKWETFKCALTDCATPAEQLFSQQQLDAMLAEADQHGVPRRWLADHPLFGDDAADRQLYTKVNEQRQEDPVHYELQLQALRKAEVEITERLSRLIAAKSLVESAHLPALPQYGTTVLAAPDDPQVTFTNARGEEQRFMEWLASKDAVAEMETQAQTVAELYKRCTAQAEVVRNAIAKVATTIQHAAEIERRATQGGQHAETRFAQARQEYLHIESVATALQRGQQALSAGHGLLQNAQTLLGAQRHLEAFTDAGNATTTLEQAVNAFTLCEQQVDELDEQKLAYTHKLATMQELYDDAERDLRRYGHSVQLPNLPMIEHFHTPLDYGLLLQQLSEIQETIHAAVRHAASEYEDEQRRLADMRSSALSSSSSSSSSFSSSSSSISSSSSSDSSSGGSISSGDSSAGGSW